MPATHDFLVISVRRARNLEEATNRGNCTARAAQLLGYVNERFTKMGYKREKTEQWGCDKLLVALRESLSEDEVAQLLAEGATWSEDRAVEAALQV